ncbi:MAG: TonB family protein [Prolixibacteraceae bacterium]|nr:TonB family protein [Prolixibacteraceae bacterium]
MSDYLKNNEHFGELIRYRNNKMTDQERYQFERVLERDPFLAEALEGFEAFKSADIEKDLNAIDLISGKKRIHLRFGRNFLYVAAASVALLVVGLLFFQQRAANQLARSQSKPVETSIPLIDSALMVRQADTIGLTDSVSDMFAQKAESLTKDQSIDQTALKETTNKKRLTEQLASKADTPRSVKKPTAMPRVVMSSLTVDNIGETTPGLVETQSNESVQPAAFTEKQVDEEKEISQTPENGSMPETLYRKGVNAQAQPLGGFDLFKQYIEREQVYPESVDGGSRETLKVSFTVTTTGQLKNFNIEKAPGNADFSNEAIRLLQNGPKWAPAVKDGIPVESQTTYRIVFRPE